jgi:hypothetical protein
VIGIAELEPIRIFASSASKTIRPDTKTYPYPPYVDLILLSVGYRLILSPVLIKNDAKLVS